MTTPAGVYPFSTMDGKPIPLDIIKPTGLIPKSFTAVGDSSFVVPSDAVVGVFISNQACLIRFGATVGAPVDATEIPNTILIPADMAVTVALTAGTCYVRGLTASGTVYLQLMEKWAALALPTQFTKK